MLTLKYNTDILFPKTNLLTGAGSIMNIAGNYFELSYSETDEDADSKAIENDWAVIGQDIKDTVKKNPAKKSLPVFNP